MNSLQNLKDKWFIDVSDEEAFHLSRGTLDRNFNHIQMVTGLSFLLTGPPLWLTSTIESTK